MALSTCGTKIFTLRFLESFTVYQDTEYLKSQLIDLDMLTLQLILHSTNCICVEQ